MTALDPSRYALADGPVDQAVALVEKRQYAEAEPLLAAAVAAAPGDARAHAYYGLVLQNLQHDSDRAIVHLEKAVALEPTSCRYHVWLGSVYGAKAQRAGLFKAASLAGKSKAAFEKAVQLDSADLGARQALFQYYLFAPGIAGGSVAKAREQAAAIARLDAYRGHLATASLEEHEKHWAPAEKAYRDALAIDPSRGLAHNNLAYFLLHQKRIDEALVEFRRYVELAPAEANAHDSLADGLVASGDVEGAVASYRKALELDPAFVSSVLGLAECLDTLGRRDEAKAQYRRYLELVPDGRRADDARKRLAKP